MGGIVALIEWRLQLGGGEEDQERAAASGARGDTSEVFVEGAPPIPVRVTRVVRGTLVQTVDAEGRAQPRRQVSLPAQVGGRVNSVRVMEGDYVRQGELLVEIESSDYADAFRDAEAALLQRQAEYAARQDQTAAVRESGFELPTSAIDTAEFRRIEDEYRRAREDLARGRIAEDVFRDIELDYQTARILAGLERGNILRAQLTAAQIAVRRAERNLERTSVRAPFDAYVANLRVEEGQTLGSGSEVLTLLDTGVMEVEVDVLEFEIALIRRGRRADVEFSALPDRVFGATIRSVNPVIDPGSRTGRVTLELGNPEGRVTVGMFGRARIEVAFHEDVLMVPQESVVERNGRTLVFSVSESEAGGRPAVAEWRYVRLGPRNDTHVVILPSDNPLEGVEEGCSSASGATSPSSMTRTSRSWTRSPPWAGSGDASLRAKHPAPRGDGHVLPGRGPPGRDQLHPPAGRPLSRPRVPPPGGLDPVSERLPGGSGAVRLLAHRAERDDRAGNPGCAEALPGKGLSLVTLEFRWDTNMEFAMLDIREKLDNVSGGPSWPPSAGRPTILRADPNAEPIMSLAVSGADGAQNVKGLAENVLKRRLEQLDGVALAAVTGGREREIQVDVARDKAEALGLSLGQVELALRSSNQTSAGALISQGRFRWHLRPVGELPSVEAIGKVVVARRGERLVRVGDVATVTDTWREPSSVARFDGAESIGLLIQKEAGSNTSQVSARVRQVLDQLRGDYPALDVDVAFDQAEFIDDSIANVFWAVVLGAVLAFLVLFSFSTTSAIPSTSPWPSPSPSSPPSPCCTSPASA